MTRTAQNDEARRKAAQSPVAWFVMLERARDCGDFEGAAAAKRELRRLGVVVSYQMPEGADHAGE